MATARQAAPESMQPPASAAARDRRSAWTEARIAADMARPSGQTMPAMVGADLGDLCALQR
jgi:hypothetical protein